MTPDQYRETLAYLGLSQSEVGRLLGVNRVTACRWAADGVNGTAAILLQLMLAGKITARDLRNVRRVVSTAAPPLEPSQQAEATGK